MSEAMTSDEPVTLASILEGRHPSVRSAGRWLITDQRAQDRPGAVAVVARRFESVARFVLTAVKSDDPELTRALVLLTQAKDAAVRAAIAESEQA
jgi:hypothetical protein